MQGSVEARDSAEGTTKWWMEGYDPIERVTPLRLAYGQPPPLAGEDGLEATIACRPFGKLDCPQLAIRSA